MNPKPFFLLALFLAPAAMGAAPMTDSKQPINITADKLEVLQPQQKAIFTGHVVAIQGATTMKSDRMTVFYRSTGEKKENEAAKPAAKKTPGTGQNSVERVEVEGNVQVVNDTENATGDHGNYDVDRKTITLTGDVVLHRDQNILRGTSLVYNIDSGQSLLNAKGAVKGTTSNGRVQGTFFPQNNDAGGQSTGGKP